MSSHIPYKLVRWSSQHYLEAYTITSKYRYVPDRHTNVIIFVSHSALHVIPFSRMRVSPVIADHPAPAPCVFPKDESVSLDCSSTLPWVLNCSTNV